MLRTRTGKRRASSALVLLLSLAFTLAWGSTETPSAPSAAAPTTQPLRALVRFGARTPLSTGLSASETWRPARYVEVRSLDADGTERARTATDAEGIFQLEVSSTGSIVLVTHFAHDGLETWVTSDAQGQTPRQHSIPVSSLPSTPAPQIVAIDLPDSIPFAGALHLLDTLGHGLERVLAWRGVVMPPLFAHWGRGETTEWSYYTGETPAGSGRFGLVLMGGDPGAQATTDTDEHYEGIVLHELGHFVMDRRSGDSSIGGRHPPGELTEPGVAWEEGRATFFAVAALTSAGLSQELRYRDTVGIEPTGSCRVDQDVETPAADNPRGEGVQESVTAILWDLADGSAEGIPPQSELPDRDGDGVALGAAGVLEAMESQWSETHSYPSLTSFLEFLVRTGRVTRPDLEAMLTRTGEPLSLLEPQNLWPIRLELGQSRTGTIDGLSNPSASGGEPRPDNHLDAVRAYHVLVSEAGMLDARVRISGSGTASDHSRVAVELRDRRCVSVDRVVSSGPQVSVVHRVEPGVYVIYVRDAGDGNRADFTLEVTLTPAS